MGTRAQVYRQNAKDCVALAAMSTDTASRMQFKAATRQWLQLADDVELLDRIKRDRGYPEDLAS
jgi:hypothetical protein